MLTIHDLAKIEGCKTDKSDAVHSFNGRSYLHEYERLFEPIRHKPIKLLEIGVYKGDSLRLWKEYFGLGEIYGLDIDPESKQHEHNRIHVFIGDQSDPNTLEAIAKECPRFDVIIDDGSHVLNYILASFRYLWPTISPGGFYAIEDLSLSYGRPLECWPGMQFNKPDAFQPNDRQLFNAELLNRLATMDGHQGDVAAIYLFSMLAFFQKIT